MFHFCPKPSLGLLYSELAMYNITYRKSTGACSANRNRRTNENNACKNIGTVIAKEHVITPRLLLY